MAKLDVRRCLSTGNPFYTVLCSGKKSEDVGYIKTNQELNAACASFAARMGVNRVRVLLGRNIMNVDSADGTFTVSVSVN